MWTSSSEVAALGNASLTVQTGRLGAQVAKVGLYSTASGK